MPLLYITQFLLHLIQYIISYIRTQRKDITATDLATWRQEKLKDRPRFSQRVYAK